MARPRKQTVDYFPHDTDASDKKTLTILQSKYGNHGYSFWFRLLEILGKTPGHFFRYDLAENWEFLLAKTHVEEEVAKKILDTLAVLDAIDPELHKYKCVWSQNFVNGLADVYEKRRTPLPLKPSFHPENGSFRTENIPETPVSASETPQSKVKETIVYKNKIKAEKRWSLALDKLKSQVSKSNYQTWFEQTTGLGYHDGCFFIGVPNNTVSEYIDKNQRSLVEKVLAEIMKKPMSATFCISGLREAS